jgi:ribonuclease G
VIDFIDMENTDDKKRVLDHFAEGLSRDRARTRVGRISSLGLVELTRKRTGESVTQEITEICPMCEGVGRIASKETVSLWIERDMWRQTQEPGNAFLVQCHPSVVEALIGLDGENVEELEHEMRRGIYIRANFDMEYEEYEIASGTIEQFDRKHMGFRRAQVLEVNVRRSAFENSAKIVGWTDDGYYVELVDAIESVGHRAKICLQDIRRSYAVAEMILPGSPQPIRALT